MEEKEKVATLKVQNGDHEFKFEMPEGANLSECYDAAFTILNHLADSLKKAVEKANNSLKEELTQNKEEEKEEAVEEASE